jgi:hypothetical protein
MGPRVYVSSTREDLKQHRDAVIAALRRMQLEVKAMEDYTAEDIIPVDRCLEDVASSQLYLGLFGWRYGFIPPGYEKSITELELRKAQECGIPTLLFVLREDHPWPLPFVDEDRKPIRQLRQELCERLMADFFGPPDELATMVATALPRELEKLRRRAEARSTPSSDRVAEPAVDAVLRALPPYLRWVVEKHEHLDLRGLRHAAGGSVQVPLEKVYVALKTDHSNPLERAEARRAMEAELLSALEAGQVSPDDAQNARWYVVAGSPIMPSLESRDRRGCSELAEVLTLGDAYRRERRLVILGDPGSGKTTIARWLSLVMAKALVSQQDRVEVPTSQVDPEAFHDNLPFLLGPPRLPVLVRVAEFAAARRERHEQGERPPTLTEFLGQHTWLNSVPMWDEGAPGRRGEPIPPAVLNGLIRTYLERGQALVILDGLDEIPASSHRDEIVEEVDAFARRWVRARYQIEVNQFGPDRIATVRADSALTEGGNQLIVTSRIAGYHAAPLRGDLTHVTVEPMSLAAVHHFFETWMQAVHEQLREPADRDRDVAERAEVEAARLCHEVSLPLRRGVRELATNPLLASVLATVFHEKGQLPGQRVELYRIAVENLTEVWHRRPMQDDESDLLETEVFDVLEPIAAHIHQHEPTGLIPENQLRELATRFLAEARGENPVRPSARLRQTVASLLKVVREDVGLLAARGEGVYGFLHLTFQEYLAARWLVRDLGTAARQLMDRLDDPRWREPVLMALGYANATFPSQFPDIVAQVLNHDGKLKDLLPQSALLLAAAVPEFARVSVDLVVQIGDRLLLAYEGGDGGPDRLPKLRELIEGVFQQLIEGGYDKAVEECLRRALTEGREQRPYLPSAAAALLRQLDWITPPLASALITALPADTGTWGWPICGALRDAVTPPVGDIPRYPRKPPLDPRLGRLEKELEQAIDPAHRHELGLRLASLTEQAEAAEAAYKQEMAEFDRRTALLAREEVAPRVDLPVAELPFRYALEHEAGLVARVTADPGWYRLIVALYGGFTDHQAPATIREYFQIASYLQLEDSERTPFEVYYREMWDRNDAVYAMAVFLDERSKLFKAQWTRKPEFRTTAIYRDSFFTRPILRALREGKPADTLMPLFEEEWNAGSDAARQAEALLALAALGRDVAQELRLPTEKGRRARDRFAQLRSALADPVVRASQHLVPLLQQTATDADPADWIAWFEAFLATALQNGSGPVDVLPLVDECPGPFSARILAEQIVHRFSGWGDDFVYYAAKFIDDLPTDPRLIAEALRLTSVAQHLRWPDYVCRWPLERLLPASVAPGDIPIGVLSAVERIPSELSYLRSWLLGTVFKKLLPDTPELLPELLAVTLTDVGAHSNRDETFLTLAPDLIDRPDAAERVLARARALMSPYYRARALWRLSPLLPHDRLGLLREAESAADEIVDPHQRVQVLERLAASTHDRSGILDKCRAAGAITHPADRARAWARLSFLHPAADAPEMLRWALAAAAEIPDESERAEDLRLLGGVVQGFPELVDEWHRLCAVIHQPNARARALGHYGRILLDTQDRLTELAENANSVLVPIVLAALLADVEAANQEQTGDGLWHRLAADPTESNRDKLVQSLHRDTVSLSGVIAQALDQVLASNNPSVAYPLLPLLTHPQPEALAILQQWLRRSRPLVARHAALLLAEYRGMSRETIPALVEFMRADDDLLRHRAGRVIHSGKWSYEEFPMRSSLLGREGIEALWQANLELGYDDPGVAIALSWHSHCLLYDDPRAISTWATMLMDNAAGAPVAARCLSYVEALTPQVWEALLQALRTGNAAVKQAVLKAVASLQHRTTDKRPRLTGKQWEEFLEVIPELDTECLKSFRLLPATHQHFIDVIQTVVTAPAAEGNPDLVRRARELLWERHGTSYADILNSEPAAVARRLKDVAASLYYSTKLGKIRAAAEAIRDNPEWLKLLLRWLVTALQEGVRDPDDPFTPERSTLLELAAAAAQFSPATFASLADPDEFEPFLYLTIRHHNVFTGRAAAVRLLGYLRRISPRVVEALHHALRDVTQVQEAVMDAAPLFRRLDQTLLRRLFEGLDDPSAMAAYATAQMLTAIGRSERTSPEQRRQILHALATAIGHPGSRRTVHFWYVDSSVPGQPRLADTFYDCMLKVAGMH